jgi:HEAT repeat protein
MLKPDRARDELARCRRADGNRRRVAALARLPRRLGAAGTCLLGLDSRGRKISDSFVERDTWLLGACHLDKLTAADRIKVFEALFPQLGTHVEAAWKLVRHLPYGTGPDRQPFRAPYHPEVTRPARVEWLRSLLTELEGYEQDVIWMATWAGHLGSGYGAEGVGLVLAAAIDKGGPEGETVFHILRDSARGKHPVGVMGRHVLRALLVASRPEGWDLVGLLLTEGHNEGLQQTIFAALEEAHPEAFRRTLRLIRQRDLGRLDAAVLAMNVWFGFHWDAVSSRIVDRVLDQVVQFLEDPKARDRALASNDAETIYLALWALGFLDALAAIDPAARLLSSPQVDRRFVAVQFLAQLQLDAARQQLIPALDDPDLRVALSALEGSEGDQEETGTSPSPDFFERLERLLRRLPPETTYLEPIVWPWQVFTAGQQSLADTLLKHRGTRSLTRLVPYLSLMETGTRRTVVHGLACHKKWDEMTRAGLFALAGDPSIAVREVVFKALSRCKLTESEAVQLEGLLNRKAADLRRGVLALLASQKDRAALASTDRLLASADAGHRLGGLELLRHLVAEKRAVEASRSRVQSYRDSRPRLSKEEQEQIDRLGRKR